MAGTVLRQRQPGPDILPGVGQANLIGHGTMQQQGGLNPPTVRAGAGAQPFSAQSTLANRPTGTSTPSQMSPDMAKNKCKNFLSTLIRLASAQPGHTATNVRCLIQGLIDGTIQPEYFTKQLEKELNSSPQPCLVPFLRNSLPHLRHSLLTKESSIEGVRPPRTAVPMLPAMMPAQSLQKVPNSLSIFPSSATRMQVLTPRSLAMQLKNPSRLQAVFPQQQRLVAACSASTASAAAAGNSLLLSKSTGLASLSSGILPFKGMPPVVRDPTAILKEKRASVSQKIDDDIIDVAAMGGVNLIEETRNILSSHAVGTEVRSCQEYNFLFTKPLRRRIADIAAKYGISEIPDDVLALMSQATQERLRSLLEKLIVIVEHRQENDRVDDRYDVTQDVRGQLRFLEEIDKVAKRRRSEQERENLVRAARSSSVMEDPEQLKLKHKAEELHEADAKKMRQGEANITASLAVGSREQQSGESSAITCSSASSMVPARPRLKRANVRDVLFLLEQEHGSRRSELLYKAYLK
ncbi:transcription initiation factor TFIID subunit 4-like [Ixodes scapularis]|uniref:transcription initiation factor TFIID subunit 4-like n=1 Tax=Ixodes scapularis TaxID=6945 RepID=UPI001C388CFD|nr:transcription initiation factor TFIID subunit 4-like [Ixodes scapularis]